MIIVPKLTDWPMPIGFVICCQYPENTDIKIDWCMCIIKHMYSWM